MNQLHKYHASNPYYKTKHCTCFIKAILKHDTIDGSEGIAKPTILNRLCNDGMTSKRKLKNVIKVFTSLIDR